MAPLEIGSTFVTRARCQATRKPTPFVRVISGRADERSFSRPVSRQTPELEDALAT